MREPAADLTADWREFGRTRDGGLRNQLVEAHLVLARIVAAQLFAQRGSLDVEFADYLQFATLGLIEAVERFDVERGVSFATFASWRIRGAVLNNLAKMSEQYQQIDLRRRLRHERLESLHRESGGGRQDLFGRLADMAVGLALSHLLEGSGMLQPTEEAGARYQQQFYDSTRERQLRDGLARLVQALPDAPRRVVRYHYFQNVPFGEIADLMGLSKGRVSQIHRQALLLLRQAHAEQQLSPREL